MNETRVENLFVLPITLLEIPRNIIFPVIRRQFCFDVYPNSNHGLWTFVFHFFLLVPALEVDHAPYEYPILSSMGLVS